MICHLVDRETAKVRTEDRTPTQSDRCDECFRCLAGSEGAADCDVLGTDGKTKKHRWLKFDDRKPVAK